MFQTLPRALCARRAARGNTVHRLAHQLRALGQAVQEPLWDRLSELSMPVLLVTGAYDRKYLEIAETFRGYPDPEVFETLMQIDPGHRQTYEDVRSRN
jgi:hypothetical protein